jgi:hypothetical protein
MVFFFLKKKKKVKAWVVDSKAFGTYEFLIFLERFSPPVPKAQTILMTFLHIVPLSVIPFLINLVIDLFYVPF